MLKITSDGRKLGLDQRIINQLLPDEPGTKVNQCVDNIMQIWRDGEADKLTQLVFCDISTPQARPAKKVAKALDNPTLPRFGGRGAAGRAGTGFYCVRGHPAEAHR